MNAPLLLLVVTVLSAGIATAAEKNIEVGAVPISGAGIVLDGSRETLDAKWAYWQAPGFKSSLTIDWMIAKDPVGKKSARVVNRSEYGAADNIILSLFSFGSLMHVLLALGHLAFGTKSIDL